jgi:hypothetical protein
LVGAEETFWVVGSTPLAKARRDGRRCPRRSEGASSESRGEGE